jgi:hypothetical protein
MRPLSAAEMLDVWDRGHNLHAVDRALVILLAACPESGRDELAAFPVGRRDALLWRLRGMTFGSEMECFTECPGCRQPLEFTIRIEDLVRADATERSEEELSLTSGTYSLTYRLPDSRDIAEVVLSRDAGEAYSLLMQRCILRANSGEDEVRPEKLPSRVKKDLSEHILAADPLCEVNADLHCVECDRRWQTPLDIISLFWTEISFYVRDLLRQVHVLAGAYGWREADIVAMSPARRMFYIDMAT